MAHNTALVILFALILLALVALIFRRTRGTVEKPFPEIQSYFTQLLWEYRVLPADSINTEYKNEAENIMEKDRASLTWDDLFALELIILRIQPDEKLHRKAWLIRDRYRGIVSPERYDAYLKSNPPGLDTEAEQAAVKKRIHKVIAENKVTGEEATVLNKLTKEEPGDLNVKALRADLEVILQNVFWHYRIRTVWEQRRNWYSQALVWIYSVLVVLGIGAVISLVTLPQEITTNLHPAFTLFVVAFMGSLGGFGSMLQRLQSIPSGSTHISLIEMEYGRHSILYQSMISGAIFATVLLILFGGGILKGDLFPDYSANNRANAGVGFIDFLRNASGNGAQFSKLLVWSFIAGFAERLVPDFLDRIIAKGKAVKEKKAS